jgi:hypothetical protein
MVAFHIDSPRNVKSAGATCANCAITLRTSDGIYPNFTGHAIVIQPIKEPPNFCNTTEAYRSSLTTGSWLHLILVWYHPTPLRTNLILSSLLVSQLMFFPWKCPINVHSLFLSVKHVLLISYLSTGIEVSSGLSVSRVNLYWSSPDTHICNKSFTAILPQTSERKRGQPNRPTHTGPRKTKACVLECMRYSTRKSWPSVLGNRTQYSRQK